MNTGERSVDKNPNTKTTSTKVVSTRVSVEQFIEIINEAQNSKMNVSEYVYDKLYNAKKLNDTVNNETRYKEIEAENEALKSEIEKLKVENANLHRLTDNLDERLFIAHIHFAQHLLDLREKDKNFSLNRVLGFVFGCLDIDQEVTIFEKNTKKVKIHIPSIPAWWAWRYVKTNIPYKPKRVVPSL
jgi:predicted nuclease with TOPRIM domain